MGKSNYTQLTALREAFSQKCFDIVEKGVEGGAFRMKDVAENLGISSQVASKIVNPCNPRTLTAFELFRMCILVRQPITDIIPPDLYLTADEMNDTELCSALGSHPADTSEIRILTESYLQLPESIRRCIFTLIRTMHEENHR